jgi:predicted lipoprotein
MQRYGSFIVALVILELIVILVILDLGVVQDRESAIAPSPPSGALAMVLQTPDRMVEPSQIIFAQKTDPFAGALAGSMDTKWRIELKIRGEAAWLTLPFASAEERDAAWITLQTMRQTECACPSAPSPQP